jgi:hypothetical protein
MAVDKVSGCVRAATTLSQSPQQLWCLLSIRLDGLGIFADIVPQSKFLASPGITNIFDQTNKC